jgi:uncharacterized RmlC-like cupin family protein
VLDRCIGEVERFADRWGREPLHVRTDDLFTDIFDLDALDAAISSTARRPEVRLVRGGSPVDPSQYTTTLRLGGRVVDDAIDPNKVADFFADGATIVLQSLHRTWPTVNRMAAMLEDEIGHPVQVNAYCTPAGAAGLAPHSDEHDVIVRQLHGQKSWHVEGLGDLDLVPGDALYIPAGTEHHAAAQAQTSLHLTIGILRITYRAVVARILATAGAHLDDPLPVGWTHDDVDLPERLATAFDQAGKTLADADPVEVAARERRRRRPRRDPSGRVASILRLPDLDGDTVVRVARGTAPTMELLDDGAVRVQLSDRSVQLPHGALSAVEQLMAAGDVRVGDLADLDAPSRVVVARRLVAEGMLEIRPSTES